MGPEPQAAIWMLVLPATANDHDRTGQLVAAARGLCGKGSVSMAMVVVGEDAGKKAAGMAAVFGIDVIVLDVPQLCVYSTEACLQGMVHAAKCTPPSAILMMHDAQGIELAPGLAMALSGGCITGVEEIDDGWPAPVFERASYGGKFLESVRPSSGPIVATIVPGAFAAAQPKNAAAGKVLRLPTPTPAARTRIVARKPAPPGDQDLTRSRVVVAAGGGIENAEGLADVERLAGLLTGSAVAGSRVVCDRGWLPHARQVGATGTTVAPALYIACGISGAWQHVIGMQASNLVVAVNRDPQATIFNHADIGVVADLKTLLPALIAACAELAE